MVRTKELGLAKPTFSSTRIGPGETAQAQGLQKESRALPKDNDRGAW